MRDLAFLLLLAAGPGPAQEDIADQIRVAQSSGKYEQAAKLYQQLIASGQDTPEIRSNCGIMLHLAGKNQEALIQFRNALHRKPDMAGANLFAGESELDLGHPRAALEFLEKAVLLAPRDPAPLLALGKAHLELREFSAANQSYSRAAELDPKLAEAWYGVGITFRSLADQRLNRGARGEDVPKGEAKKLLEQALAALDRALALDPNSARAHLIMAESLRDSGKLVDAVAEYETAIKLDPKMEAAYLGLATGYWQRRQFDDALPLLKHVLAKSPKDPEANGMMADILEQEGEFDKARAYAHTALAGNPDLIATRLALARIDLATGHPDRTINDLQSILGADRHGVYHYLLYRAYKQLGKQDEARAALREVERLRRYTPEK